MPHKQDVAAGKSANDTIWLSDSFRRTAGIETVADIIMNFHVSSSDSYDTLFTVKAVELYLLILDPDSLETLAESGVVSFSVK